MMTDDPAPPSQYLPSGSINALRLIPLLAAAMAVALGMGYVLYLAEEHLYFVIFTPLIVAIPVFAAMWAVIELGHCRNPVLGKLIGLVLYLFYYVGYCEFSYQGNVVAAGPGAVAAVQQISGAPGLPGYVIFRWKTSVLLPMHDINPAGGKREPTLVDQGFNAFFFFIESVLFTGVAASIGRDWSRRIYYEESRRWSSKLMLQLPIESAGGVLRAIKAADWETIAALPRAEKTGKSQAPMLNLRIDYLAGAPEQPAYLTLMAIGTRARAINVLDGPPVALPRGGIFYYQATLPPSALPALARHFPQIKLTPS